MKQPKVALATEFLVQYGGAQKTLEAIAELYPDSPIYTAKYDPKNLSESINNRKIVYPKGRFITYAAKQFFMFMMAPIFEAFDFRDYDIVISDGTTWTKGILTKPNQLHISYIHTPPRFLYKYSREGVKWEKGIFKLFFANVLNILRLWDFVAAQRPEYLVTNSNETRKRINKFYRRDAIVIYPPVEITYKGDTKIPENINGLIKKPYYIGLGRFESYKNFNILVKAFNKLDLNLVLIGGGNEEERLKALAEGNDRIIFTGRSSDEEKHALIENSLGLINPVVDEDFGIVPIEVQAHGKPVLAHRSGGHLETVQENVTGMFFDEVNEDALAQAIKDFNEKIKTGFFDSNKIKQSIEKFSKERFQKELKNFIDEKWQSFCNSN